MRPPASALPLALAAALSACADQIPTQAPARPAQPALAAAPASQEAHPGERAFHALARQFPEFGGFFLDDNGDLVIQATDGSRGNAMRAAVGPLLSELHPARGGARGRRPSVVIRKAEFSFSQLSAWREQVRAPLFDVEEVALLDLDERTNRLFVGLTRESGRGAALAVLRRAGVPEEAVTVGGVSLDEPIDPNFSEQTAIGCTSLRDICRPLMGGLQTVFMRDGQTYVCSIGFTALSAGQPRFVTAAHCSDDEWNLDHTAYYQPKLGNSIGTEVKDPNGWSCGFLSPYKCRYSDANLVQPSVPVEVGYIARPSAVGSLTISASNPRFVVSRQRDAYVGERVYAIGRTTGMVGGTVDKTCTDFKKTWEGRFHAVLCSDVADYNASGGDSGGPVILWDGASSTVTLVGVNYARTGIYDHAFFSPLSGIQRDLGSLEARAPEYRTTSTGGGGTAGPGCEGSTSPVSPREFEIIEPC